MMRTTEGGTRLGSGLRALPQRLFFPPLTGGRSWLGKLRRTSFWRHQVKKRIAGLLRLLTDWALFILVVLTGGLISAYYMMDRGSSLSTINSGPWTMWTAAARTDADPYTVAHFARLGALPLPSEVGETWLARTDSAGSTLHSSCDYEIAVRPPQASWWSIAVRSKTQQAGMPIRARLGQFRRMAASLRCFHDQPAAETGCRPAARAI